MREPKTMASKFAHVAAQSTRPFNLQCANICKCRQFVRQICIFANLAQITQLLVHLTYFCNVWTILNILGFNLLCFINYIVVYY